MRFPFVGDRQAPRHNALALSIHRLVSSSLQPGTDKRGAPAGAFTAWPGLTVPCGRGRSRCAVAATVGAQQPVVKSKTKTAVNTVRILFASIGGDQPPTPTSALALSSQRSVLSPLQPGTAKRAVPAGALGAVTPWPG
jgi:hypothetical protein